MWFDKMMKICPRKDAEDGGGKTASGVRLEYYGHLSVRQTMSLDDLHPFLRDSSRKRQEHVRTLQEHDVFPQALHLDPAQAERPSSTPCPSEAALSHDLRDSRYRIRRKRNWRKEQLAGRQLAW